MGGLIALLDEESQLFAFHAVNQWEAKSMSWLNLEDIPVAALALPRCLPAESKGAKGLSDGQSPASLLASELACLRTLKAWHNCELLPSKLGSCLRQSHCYLPWINNLSYQGAACQFFPLLAALQPFNLLSSLMASEPGGIGRSSASVHGFPL